MPTLVIGDLHQPFTHENYFNFCCKIHKKYKCTKTIFIGDIFDNHAISYHEHSPDGHSAGSELQLAREKMQPWYNKFPKAKVTLGNHDQLPFRKAKTHGFPSGAIRSYREQWGAPKDWEVALEFNEKGVLYTHGIGFSGMTGHVRACKAYMQSTVIGHIHSHAGIHYSATKNELIFGMNVGCGIDPTAYSFEYGKYFPNRPIIGCGVVLNKHHAIFIPMEM